MNAKITYQMAYGPHPWNEEKRKEGMKIWCLYEVTTPEMGMNRRTEPIAVFNLDSEAERFQAHIFTSGLDLIEIDQSVAESLNSLSAARKLR